MYISCCVANFSALDTRNLPNANAVSGGTQALENLPQGEYMSYSEGKSH